MVDMNDAEETKTEIKNSIEILLRLAYEELIEPRYAAYPTSDLIACFLDAEEAFGSEFLGIFNNAVRDYKDNFEGFKKEIIEQGLDKILEALSQLKESEESNFDFFSKEHRVICNMALASTLLPIYTYASSNQGWLNNKKEELKKSTLRLLETYISGKGKGWQYYFIEGTRKYVHTLPTWLSLLSLTYIPEGIITEDQRNEIEIIKKEVKEWLEKKLRENKCCSCFRPEELDDKDENTPNPIATAQAVLALHHAGMDISDETIKCSIEFIKDKKTSIETFLKDEIPTKRIGQNYQGVQCCLQALLIYGTPYEDETVQYLLEKTIKFVNNISSKRRHKLDLDKYSYYPTLTSLLFYLFPPAKPVLLGSTDLQNIFNAFVSDANSIVLVGEIDITYANLIPEDKDVMVLYRDKQDPVILDEHHWKEKAFKIDSKFDNINYVIVDGNRALFSSNPFCVTTKYNFPVHLKGEEVSLLINQLKKITGREISTRPVQDTGTIRKEILDRLGEFPRHREIIEPGLEEMEAERLQGVLDYFKLVPEQTEEALAPALGFEDRRAIEREFSRRGIFSRVFVNSDLKELLEKSVATTPTRYLIFDESSAYLLLNTEGTPDEEKVINCFSDCLAGSELFATADIHEKLRNFLRGKIEDAKIGRVAIIEDRYKDQFNELTSLHGLQFTEDEKIAIGYATQGGEDYGIITNSWEVAKMCKENKIKTFSLMKFLEKEKNEKIYKIFRIPIDEFKQ